MTKALRVGLMVPGSNTTMEGEMRGFLPPGSAITRIGIPPSSAPLTPATMPDYQAAVVALAAQHFSRTTHDLLVYGCTAAGFAAGPAGDAALAAALAEATGLRVVTTARAMVLGLQRLGAQQIAVVTPYSDAVNAQLEAFLADGGIGVTRMDSLRAPDVAALCAIQAPEVEALARRTMAPDCDALFIGCTQLPTQAFLAELARDVGRPVLSSISATAEQALRV
ncbi:maleate cis-trans isomerase family protein [Falsiroseomonas tokyonensis]|uniref:Aspartate/glutamate racemase family protein n=1 Tax=Falsiroseomonas tokyonensis TaxID=430521 RepID=A0ABV7BUD8_9PROT|nr:aspartate/glutamate racemase family protein [Falsiroseomonas tokyonensis]MBU8539218.1 aspartate/glutamate racemase family protein [Falsiroseomonas tokyonensis]